MQNNGLPDWASDQKHINQKSMHSTPYSASTLMLENLETSVVHRFFWVDHLECIDFKIWPPLSASIFGGQPSWVHRFLNLLSLSTSIFWGQPSWVHRFLNLLSPSTSILGGQPPWVHRFLDLFSPKYIDFWGEPSWVHRFLDWFSPKCIDFWGEPSWVHRFLKSTSLSDSNESFFGASIFELGPSILFGKTFRSKNWSHLFQNSAFAILCPHSCQPQASQGVGMERYAWFKNSKKG